MARARKHKDVEFTVDDARGRERTFDTFDEAAGFAVSLSASDGRARDINVLVYSRAGARWWGGDDAVEEYEADPDASAYERIRLIAEAQGRVY